MNREIKFRVWDNGDSRMKYADIEYFDDMVGFRFQHRHFEEDDNSDIILMQYTGLKDKNGKEIYEGDIVRLYDEENRVVEFKNAFWQLELCEYTNCLGGFGTETESGHKPLYRYSKEWIEVIGNIYETPHLINSEQTAPVSDTTKA